MPAPPARSPDTGTGFPCRETRTLPRTASSGARPRSDGRGDRVSAHRSRTVAAALLATLALLPVAGAPVLARDDGASEQARILNYWTRERIANAKPRDFVRNADGSFSRAKPTPQAKPGGGGSGTNVLGASWTGGGAVLKLSGKVLFTMDSGDYICSGTLINDSANDRSIVITAGHCSYDAADGGFAPKLTFSPRFTPN